MKEIVARDQVALGAVRCLRLAITGMSYRLFRSSITIAILALAVAFLVHMLSFSILSGKTRGDARVELSGSRRLGEIVTRMANADAPAEVRRVLASARSDRLSEYRRFAGPSAAFDEARDTALHLDRIGRFLTGLPVATRAVLLGDLTPEQLWVELEDGPRFERFLAQLSSSSVRLPGVTADELRRLIHSGRARLAETVAAITLGHERAVRALAQRYPEGPAELAAHPPPDLAAALVELGFSVAEDDIARLGVFSEGLRVRTELRRLLLDADVRAAVARQMGSKLGEVSVDAVVGWTNDPERAAWLSDLLASADSSFAVSASRLFELLRGWDRERLLVAAAGGDEAVEPLSGELGLDTRTRWLITLSFIVCVVGVANAMLMSVTERFTEIATMKCLGAMDGFVMLMFVFEAMLQGVAGGVLGVVLGLLLALLRGVVDFGQLLGGALGAAGELALAGLFSLLVGVLLAALAAIGPAWIASRLAPMEAMRVE
jgi:putative ABC transport system permease protein